jgi:hypothetical protein
MSKRAPFSPVPPDTAATNSHSRVLFANAVHWVSQKKGGVGKSSIAMWLAEYLRDRCGSVRCYDTDPSQHTFARVQDLEVNAVKILSNDEVDPFLINPMLNEIIDEQGPFVVDTGSSSFHALWSYIQGAELFDLLLAHERPVIIHVPLAPKPELEDTLIGFDEICQLCPDHSVVVWINERENPVEIEGASFFDLKVMERNRSKVLAVITNHKQRRRWNRQVVGQMLLNHQTFAQAIASADTITRSYLQQVRNELFTQLDEI